MTFDVQVDSVINFGKLAWKWLDDNLELFDPWRDAEFSTEGLQCFAELTIVFVRLRNSLPVWNLLSNNQAPERWRDHIVTRLTTSSIAELPRKRPLHSFPYILPYLVMRAYGFRDSYWEQTLALLGTLGLPQAQEVVPFRELDVAYFTGKSGYYPACDLLSLYRRTFLARMHSSVYVDDDSAYSITHSIFYLSDFGMMPLPLGTGEITRVQDIVESLMVHYWRHGHWDLLGELLISSLIIGHTRRSLWSRVFAAFTALQHPDGALPGRLRVQDELASARLTGDYQRLFTGYYHTTVVGLLLSAQAIEDPV